MLYIISIILIGIILWVLCFFSSIFSLKLCKIPYTKGAVTLIAAFAPLLAIVSIPFLMFIAIAYIISFKWCKPIYNWILYLRGTHEY